MIDMKDVGTIDKKQCEYCVSSFYPRYSAQRFCSLGCANLFQKSLYPKFLASCLFCKKTFGKQYKSQKFCSLKCSANADRHSNRHKVVLPDINDPRLAELLGIMAGDGNFGPRFFVISLNAKTDNDYAIFVWKLAQKLFPGATVTIHYKSRGHVHRIQISSVMVIKFLRRIWPDRKQIPIHILSDKGFKINFVRGLIDTEGSIGFKIFKGAKGFSIYKQLTFTNYNNDYRQIVHDVLKQNGFNPTLPARNIYISNKSDIERYFNLIGSHNSKMKVKNSIETYKDYIEYKERNARIDELFDNLRKYGNLGGVPEPG